MAQIWDGVTPLNKMGHWGVSHLVPAYPRPFQPLFARAVPHHFRARYLRQTGRVFTKRRPLVTISVTFQAGSWKHETSSAAND